MTPVDPGDGRGPERADLQLVEVLQALADPVRLQAVRVLDQAHRALACNEFDLPVAKSTGSHHLRVLREAGVIEAELDGTRKLHRLRRSDLEARFPGLLESVLRAEPDRVP